MSLFSQRTTIGLDLGHFSMKACQVERAGTTWKVVKTAWRSTPPDCVRDGVVVEPHALADAIRQMLKDAGIHATAANIAVSGGSVVVRSVRIPKMAEATLRKSIRYEASRYVPNSVEDSYIEFEILGESNEENQNDVLVVAAPRELVDSRIEACKMAGLEVDAVDVEAFASYRSLIESDHERDGENQVVALADIGALTTNMSVVSRGRFAMSRTIPNAGHTLTDALKHHFKMTDEDAENGKSQVVVSELIDDHAPKENPPLRVIQPHVDDLVREVRRSLNYFQSQQTDGSADRQVSLVMLTGGGAKLQGIAEYFAHKLSLPTVVVGVYDNTRFVHSGDPNEFGHEYSVACGLAMRAFAKANKAA